MWVGGGRKQKTEIQHKPKGGLERKMGVKTWVGKAAGKLKENRKMTEKWFI